MKDFRELERTADIKYRDFCFKRWRRIAKTHFEYVYAALLIQNRIRIRFAKRILRSKVRMVLAKQAVQRDKLEAAIATLYHAALPLQRLWRGYRGKSEYSAFKPRCGLHFVSFRPESVIGAYRNQRKKSRIWNTTGTLSWNACGYDRASKSRHGFAHRGHVRVTSNKHGQMQNFGTFEKRLPLERYKLSLVGDVVQSPYTQILSKGG